MTWSFLIMKIYRLEPQDARVSLTQISDFLANLSQLYPGFQRWFASKVVQSPDSVILVATEQERLAGVALGKIGADPKLRCVRVHDSLQGSGLGLKLIDQMFEHLGHETPHCTVAEEMLHGYSRVFVKRYGFRLSDVIKGEYRPHKLEYHWN